MDLLKHTACMLIGAYSAWIGESAAAGVAEKLLMDLVGMLTTGRTFFLLSSNVKVLHVTMVQEVLANTPVHTTSPSFNARALRGHGASTCRCMGFSSPTKRGDKSALRAFGGACSRRTHS